LKAPVTKVGVIALAGLSGVLLDICVLCARVCPTGVVTVTDEVTTDAADCINCMACVKACPTGARVRNAALDKANQSMNEKLVERREPDLYL
jgi:ferredoxin